ncbi:tetratricopeptide repeat protein [Tenacibaculum tangerinum]|uniref:Tetratricopeptide repeat protein n=1 Tax=Tenacibaculum tangerinum TaxID=3038772 RepID=A0ABY8L0G7_9FLAO|nr:tetratricopeptide repeat protein [Tenacibaculum tangerinum]WGH74132.1 tetratricopeptide repeat protein [Tenacibaculum tangerinum]
MKGIRDKAMDKYMEASKLSQEINYSKGIVYSAISLASIYLEAEEYEKVVDIFETLKKKNAVAFKQADNLLLAVMYNNEGIAYENLNNYNKAEQLYNNSIEVAKKLPSKYYLANAMSNLASVKFKQQKYNESITLNKEVLEIRYKNDFKIGIIQSLGHLAGNYLSTNNIRLAEQYYEEALKEAKKINSPKYKHEISKALKDIYVQRKEFKKAYEIQEIELESREEFLNEESLKKEARLKADYENELTNQINKEKQKRRELIFYFILGILLLVLIIFVNLFLLQKNKIVRTKLINENIKKEKILLEQDLDYKNKKLVTNLMYILKDNKFIMHLLKQLSEIKKIPKTQANKEIDKLIRKLRIETKKQPWDEFEIYFQEVHVDFYKRLSEKYNLTPNELKIAAFIKLNLSSKEISSITNQNTRTIDVARYRLRKKLGINNTDTNLISFLNKI